MSQAVPYTTIPTSSTNLLAINGIVVDKLTGEFMVSMIGHRFFPAHKIINRALEIAVA